MRIELDCRGGEVVHHLRHAIGRHEADDARQVAEGGEDGGRLQRDHRRPAERAFGRRDGDGEVGDVGHASGDLEQPRLLPFVEEGLLAARDRRDDRFPDVVALGRFGNVAFLAREDFLVIDLFQRERRVAVHFPDARRPAARAPIGGIERQDRQEGMDRFGRHVAEKGDAQQIAIVQQRGGFSDGRLRRIGGGAFDHERVGRDPDREHGAERRLVDCVAQTLHRHADGWMFGRIERPVARGDDQRSRQLQQTARQLRGQLGRLGHGVSKYTAPIPCEP